MVQIEEDELRQTEIANSVFTWCFLGGAVSLAVILLADNGSVFLEFVKWIGGM